MLVNGKNMLNHALKNKYAVSQFNINNLEWTKYILEECQKLNSPVILGASEGAIKYMGGYNVVYGLVFNLIKDLEITIPVCLHLDHGTSFENCKKAIDAGFTSVMIDASNMSFEKNIKITKKVVEYAKEYNVTIEAELGKIGGTEDGVTGNIVFAKKEECVEFVFETNIDFLAPALGSVHGFYKGTPNLNYTLMKEINKNISIPLVLHGGSGLEDEDIKKSISLGISKINVNTDLQQGWSEAVRKLIFSNEKVYDPRKIISSGEQIIKKIVKSKVEMFGSMNKAQTII